MAESETDARAAGDFGGLLDDGMRPDRVTSTLLPDRVRIRLPLPGHVAMRVIPTTVMTGLGIGVLGIATCFASPVPESVFGVFFVIFAALPLVGLAVGLVTQAMISGEQSRIARQVDISPHRITLRGAHDVVLAQWGLHDLEDLWASRDWLSASIAVQRQGGVEAVRLPNTQTARWLLEVMKNWRDERLQAPDEEGLEAVAALYAGAKRETAR